MAFAPRSSVKTNLKEMATGKLQHLIYSHALFKRKLSASGSISVEHSHRSYTPCSGITLFLNAFTDLVSLEGIY